MLKVFHVDLWTFLIILKEFLNLKTCWSLSQKYFDILSQVTDKIIFKKYDYVQSDW